MAIQKVVSMFGSRGIALTNAGTTKDLDIQKYIVGLHLMKHLGKFEEVVSRFIFLTSNDSTFIKGTSLEIEGGYLSQ